MIFLASVFRNSERYIDRYAGQVKELRAATHVPVHVIAVEGDSDDHTYDALWDCDQADTVLKCEHGGPPFGSVIHKLRWRQLSTACNVALCAAVRMCEEDDQFIYVESDLIWDADLMLGLIRDLEKVQAVAPMSMDGMRFYDIWGHTIGDRGFSPHPPFYPGWYAGSTELTRIDSAGSCFALTHAALQVVEFSAVDCIRGVGRSLNQNGIPLWIDPSLRVEHP